MNNTFKKRIDELGRIVIPKQIRDTFKIKNFDELELYIENDNIVISKTGGILLIKDKLDNLLYFIKKYLDINIFIVDKNVVISSNIEKLNYNDILNINFDDYINKLEYLDIKHNETITSGYIKSFNLILDSNNYGSVVFVLKDNKDNQEMLNDIIKIIIDMLK